MRPAFMRDVSRIPVLIVGAGPTGLVLALWLTKAGVAVRIIDKTAEAGTTSRAIGVQARTLELYRQMGIADEVMKEGSEVAGGNFWVGGKRVARIGPLPLVAADSLAAVYMEGVFQPGMSSVVHRHPGAEAWYTLEGSMCVETPNGALNQRAGQPGVVVRDGLPMRLTGIGTGPRRSLVLILQDATKPRSTPAHDWMPKGLCGA